MKKTPMRTACIAFLLAPAALVPELRAQPPAAPSNEPVGNPRGDNVAGYNVTQSFETGYRWRTVGGDAGMYRSTVNYGNGIRLLSSSLSVQSRDGHGGVFDHLALHTQGLGNDPYQSASLRIEKNHWYRYDLLWRSSEYFNPALTISFGEHFKNTTRRMQDHDFTLFPQSSLKLFLGYSRNVESGPALSTIQLFDFRGDEYPLFSNIHREQKEYRLGGEVTVLGFRLNVMHGWEDFKEDTPVSLLPGANAGNNPDDASTLAAFRRTEPYHGASPYWRGAIFGEGRRRWAVNGRFTYVAGKRAFVENEFSNGTDRAANGLIRQILTFGDARRPTATGNLTVSWFPSSVVTITNQTSVYNIRMIGNSYFTEADNGVAITPYIAFDFLGIRSIANSASIDVRPRKWFAVHSGYHYDNRLIGVVDGQLDAGGPPPAPPDSTPFEQTNQLHAGAIGFRLKPAKPLTVLLDGEVGRSDHPYTPISDKNYQVFRARIEYKQRTHRFAAYAKTDYNTNSISLTSFASRSRQYGADASWIPNEWFAIDAGYAKMHLDTLGGINYFLGRQTAPNESSLYVSNIHAANLGARFSVMKRAEVYLGYSHVQDTGDGRATRFGPGIYTALPALQAAQTFPLRFESPQARLSLPINRRVRWNAGYQYYGYTQHFSAVQNYRAHTGYSSISWAF